MREGDAQRLIGQVEAKSIVNQAARSLGIPVSRFEANDNIGALLGYFNTGKFPEGSGDVPIEFVQPRLLRMQTGLFAVRTVMRTKHPLIATVEEAYVSFSGEDRPSEIASWRVVDPEKDDGVREGGLGHTFSSIWTVQENLREFAQVAAPVDDTDRFKGELKAEQWLRDNQ